MGLVVPEISRPKQRFTVPSVPVSKQPKRPAGLWVDSSETENIFENYFPALRDNLLARKQSD